MTNNETYANTLRYAGSRPFQPEKDRVEDPDDPLTYRIQEQLEQDDV